MIDKPTYILYIRKEIRIKSMFFKDKKKHLIQIKFIFGTQYIVCS